MSTTDGAVYRVIAADGFFHNFTLHKQGAEIAWSLWPTAALEPISPIAVRIARYHARHFASASLPRSPWDAAKGSCWLPGLPLPSPPRAYCPINFPKGSEIQGLVLDKDVDAGLPAMPEYELLVDTHLGMHNKFEAGSIVRFVGWPVEGLMRAANHPARLVQAYFKANRDHPKLEVRGPWCWASGLHLPELPEIIRRPDGTTMAPLAAGARKAHPDGSYVPPTDPAFEAAVVAEIEAVTGRRPGEPGSIPPTYPSATPSRINRATKPFAPRREAWKE